MFNKLKEQNTKLVIVLISLLALFMHGKLPFMLHLSVLSFLLVGFQIVFFEPKNKLKQQFILYVRSIWLYIVVGIIYILFALFKFKNHLVLKESIYAIYILVLIYFLYINRQEREKNIQIIIDYFSKGFILFTIILALGFYYNIIFKSRWFGLSMNNQTDYNYLSLAYLSAIIIIAINNNKFKGLLQKISGVLLIIAFEIPILFSGSRRGLIFLFIIHGFLIFYSFNTWIRRNKNSLIRAYLILLLFLIGTLFFLFSFNSVAWRNYTIDQLFQEKAVEIKTEYTKIRFRYLSITGTQLEYKDLYKSLWSPELFQAKGLFDKIIFLKERASFIQLIENKDFDQAFNKLILVSQFSTSQEEFIGILPDEYKALDHIGKLELDDFGKIPYKYPIPYLEKNFITLVKVKNLDLIKIPDKRNESLEFKLSEIKPGIGHITSYFLMIPNTASEISIEYSGIGSNKLNCSFSDVFNSRNKLKFVDTLIVKGDDSYKKLILIDSKFNKPGVYFFNMRMDIPIDDTFKIHRSNLMRNVENLHGFDSLEYKLVNRYIGAQKRKKIQLKRINNEYLHASIKLTNNQKDSIEEFIANYDEFNPIIRKYGRYATSVEMESGKIFFTCPKEVSFCRSFFLFPVISSGVYDVNLKVKSIKRPSIYIKRFPEVSPNFIEKTDLKKEINEIEKGLYSINYEFRINSTASALSAIVVGVNGSEFGDMFEIIDVHNELINLEDTIVSKYQYSYLKPHIDKLLFEINVQDKIENNYRKYNWFKETISNESNLYRSRLDRWRFAYIYFKDQKWLNKILGSGFNYLSIYPLVFDDVTDIKEYDYPHNPIISAFLYSGIIGGLFYIYFLLLSFIKYWKNKKELQLFGVFYLVTFGFTFFSGNSHFSVPAFTILSLIPFIFDTIRKRRDKC